MLVGSYLNEPPDTVCDVLGELGPGDGALGGLEIHRRDLLCPGPVARPLVGILERYVQLVSGLERTSIRMDTDGPHPSNIASSLSCKFLRRNRNASSSLMPHSCGPLEKK